MAKTIETGLGEVKIGTEKEAFWEEVRKSTEEDIKRLEKLLTLQRAIYDMCINKIKEESK